MGYTENIQKKTLENTNFREVLYTGAHMQLVVMSLKPLEDIGMEVHPNVDQFFRIEKGQAKVIMNGEEAILTDDMVAIVPAGVQHNVINISNTEDLKLYTIYAPANHPEGTIHATKADAMAAEEHEHNQ
ncbi:MAG TPA: cupin domain-containing protein [Candidatus Dojkabacteria bacterium]|jgi:mannose-6-phosphate isomerase-like protein (cupin superfamily)|nr:cupin domain-containing protein [Candidatus Dojkabacteria bacterium]HOV17612.1 cupin domain-containing protein [Candidatus Dojkabacteria bacterium]HPM14075.1 cupin domain-containing protein [Candidatus Dojkabacteria bacterium]HQJ73604.1 cupin domain-containing protein [Candidatus Dojkabacteria bacterium]